MAQNNAPLIVFDLDGTLVDSAPDLVAALNTILARDGIAPLSLERGRRFVGRGGRVLIENGLAASGATVSPARLEEMFAAFLAVYESHLAERTVYYPGVEAALDRLAGEGHAFAICTNKFEKPAKMLIRALGGTDRFRVICGQDTFPVSKPNAGALRLTIEKAGGDPGRAIMVGDTKTDIATARDTALPVIAVDFGYAPEPVASLAPDRIIGDFAALPDAVASLAADLARPISRRHPSDVF